MSNVMLATRDGALVATIVGRIDGRTAPELQDQLLPAMEGAMHAVYDVSQVDFMSSAGFRLLLLLCRMAATKGGQLSLVGLSDDIRDTMEMTGFLEFFVLCTTLDEALTKVRNESLGSACAR
jgi:anti-sigma B factor antagonist